VTHDDNDELRRMPTLRPSDASVAPGSPFAAAGIALIATAAKRMVEPLATDRRAKGRRGSNRRLGLLSPIYRRQSLQRSFFQKWGPLKRGPVKRDVLENED
jgi:hypothetical protein